jgi:hypothetical protein
MQKQQWLLFAFISLGSAFFAYRYFDQAIPLVHVKITMDNDQAICQAKGLDLKYGWGVQGYNVVTKYQESSELQAFVELEGGGKKAFIDMIEQNHFQPYTWCVRFFKEKDAHELKIHFTPTGQPYQFLITLPEQHVGSNVSKDQALQIALHGAKEWDVDLSDYEQVEYNKEEIMSGRVDHSFIYQRKNIAIAKGLYRIKLKVSGNLFSGLSRSVKIPDEFKKRYAQMFSLNKTLARAALNIGSLIYLFIFALFIFVFFFGCKQGLLWKQSFKIFLLFSALFGLEAFNSWPLMWNNYQTQVSMLLFAFQMILSMLATGLLFALFIGAIVLLAEAAGRHVFFKQIQFFKLCTKNALGSYQILQQVVIGYGVAMIFLGYGTGFALLVQKLGWWAPLSTLIDPNILSTRVACITPLVNAFQAGFLEEFLFRALPIAGILLLTARSVYKKQWFAVIFVVQIIIFGAMHANYPQQPAYYRVIELIFGGSMFGALYYVFGLLPCIIAHFVYDAFLMCLPIFVSNLYGQKVMAVLIILLPLLAVFVAWFLQGKKLKNLSSDFYNQALKSVEKKDGAHVPARTIGQRITPRLQCVALILGGLGFLFWFRSGDFDFNASRVSVSMAQVEVTAKDTVAKYFAPLGSKWVLTREYLTPKDSMGCKFVLQVLGNDAYQKLQGNYLTSPAYSVKFVQLEGPVEERAESFEVVVQADGSVSKIVHTVPEFWKGADLDQDDAQSIAFDLIKKTYDIHDSDLQLVSCQSVKHADRRDWTVVFKDLKNYIFDVGQARIEVKLCGDQLHSIMRFVQTPELWQREEQNRNSEKSLATAIQWAIIILLCVLFMLFALARFGISVRYFKPFALFTFGMVAIQLMILGLDWYQILHALKSSEPFIHQLVTICGSAMIQSLAIGAGVSVLVISVIYFGTTVKSKKMILDFTVAVPLGMAVHGLQAWLISWQPVVQPCVPYLSASDSISPTFNIFLLQGLMMTVCTGAVALALFFVVQQVVQKLRIDWILPLFFMILGLVCFPVTVSINANWFFSGLLSGLVWYFLYYLFLKKDSDLIWILIATTKILQIVPSAWYGAYPGIVGQLVVAGGLTFATMALAQRKI